MLLQGYKCSDIDYCLYKKRAKGASLLSFILYVDGMLIVGSNIDVIATL